MKYIVESEKSVDQATQDFEVAVKRHGFGVLHVYDLKSTLQSKGFDLPDECRILDVCNPAQAINVLSIDMTMNLALPCRVSVFAVAGKTHIGMIRPTLMLGHLSDSATLRNIALEVEDAMINMIDEAA